MTSTKLNARAGAYGDPANVPIEIWRRLYQLGVQGTGYTHQWRTCNQELRNYCMASVQSHAEAIEAQNLGWRTYRVDLESIGPLIDEIFCPEQTRGISCDECLLCGGNRKHAKNIVITPIRRGSSPAKCYVNTGWLSTMWLTWCDGNMPRVDAATLGKYMAGEDPTNNFTSVEVWRGNSPIDNEPIVLIATGLSRSQSKQSKNRKTGPMVQTHILRQDMRPIEAVNTGADVSICGDCPLRQFNAA